MNDHKRVSVRELQKGLLGADESTSEEAARELARRYFDDCDDESLDVLIGAMQSENQKLLSIAIAAAGLLGRRGEPTIASIIPYLSSRNLEIVRGAILALGNMRDSASNAVAKLETLMDHSDDKIQSTVLNTLSRITGNYSYKESIRTPGSKYWGGAPFDSPMYSRDTFIGGRYSTGPQSEQPAESMQSTREAGPKLPLRMSALGRKRILRRRGPNAGTDGVFRALNIGIPVGISAQRKS